MPISRARGLVALAMLTGATPLFGQLPAPASTPPQRDYNLPDEPHAAAKADKVLHAYRVQDGPPRIDGRLDDPIWAAAQLIDDLIQVEPDNLQAPTQRTTAQIAYDDRYLYVAIGAYDTDSDRIVSGLGRRDSPPPSDAILLSFDPRHDHLTAYIYTVNPSGVQSDRVFFNDTQQDNDYSGVWDVETQITAEGWTAEYRIPFSQMQFAMPAAGEVVVWGFTLRRDILRRGEIIRWVGLPRSEVGFVSLFGHLVFDPPMAPPRRLEVQPFVFTRRADLLAGATEYEVNGGLDLRVGLGTRATLAATVNPDFGQVEQDPAVLNLSVFETFFPERRAFFLEDAGVFRLPYPQFPMFHSRRIGARPGRLALQEGDMVVDRPEQTTILGAAKATGRQSGWTWGALTALTDREYALVDAASPSSAPSTPPLRERRLIEPLTSYSVVRAQRDILGGTSNMGAIATGVMRGDGDADAFTGGIDYTLRWMRNLFQLNGHWAATHAPFPDGQRTGFGGASNFSYFGDRVGVDAHFDYFSPSFRSTDLGFKRGRVDQIGGDGTLWVRERDPWGFSRNVQVGLGGGSYWNTDGLDIQQSARLNFDLTTIGFWYVGAFAEHQFETLDDLDTRGGPPIIAPARDFMNVFVRSDSRRTWQAGLGVNGGRDAEGGWDTRLGPFIGWRAGSLQTNLEMGFTSGRDDAQWITNTDATGDGVPDHVYGSLRQRVLDVTGRVTYAVDRDLTFELFLQPFVAVGDYSDIRRLAAPRSYSFEPVTLSYDPDFNRKSLRSNVIMRWEYVRGSTLFVVWNASSLDRSRPGEFDAWRDLGDAFGAAGDQVFMVKLNYWLGM